MLGTPGLIHGAAHISGGGGYLVKVKPLLERVGIWRDFPSGWRIRGGDREDTTL